MGTHLANSDTRVTRIIDRLASLRMQLPVSDSELSLVLGSVPRICLDQIHTDLASNDPGKRSRGISHITEHLAPYASQQKVESNQSFMATSTELDGAALLDEGLDDEPDGCLETPISELHDDAASILHEEEPAPPDPMLHTLSSPESRAMELHTDDQEPYYSAEPVPTASLEQVIKHDPEEAAESEHSILSSSPAFSEMQTGRKACPGFETELIDHVLEIDYLQSVRGLIERYCANRIDTDHDKEARKIFESLWQDQKMAQEFGELISLSNCIEGVSCNSDYARQLDTFLLGSLIIHLVALEYRKANKLGILGQDEEMAFLTWLMATTAQDAGYPLEYGRHAISALSGMYARMGMGRYSELLDALDAQLSSMNGQRTLDIASNGPERRSLDVCKLTTDILEEHVGHGTMGCAIQELWDRQAKGLLGIGILWRTLILSGRISMSEESRELSALRSATTALALQDLRSDYLPFTLDFEKLPYAFLLVLMNELQEISNTASHHISNCAWYELSAVDVVKATWRTTIKLTFQIPDDLELDTRAVRENISSKRRKLADLSYAWVPANCNEVEVHAEYKANTEVLGSITAVILHRA